MSTSRRLRILFCVRPKAVTRVGLLVSELAARGHEVRLAFPKEPDIAEQEFLDALVREFPRVAYEVAPRRSHSDGWRSVALLVRIAGDLALCARPRYADAPALREWTARKLRGIRWREFDPLSRSLGRKVVRRLTSASDARLSERVIRLSRRLENAIPTTGRVDTYVRECAPDIVLSASVMDHWSDEIELLKSARRLGLPTGVCVSTWDRLTTHGLLKFVPEQVFVWNDVQAREAVELHSIPADRVVATGAYPFDVWFGRRPTQSREEVAQEFGLDPAHPYVLYICSAALATGDTEAEFVLRWIEALRASSDERIRRLGIAIRPYPSEKSIRNWRGTDVSGFENVAVCESRFPAADDARAAFFDALAHSVAVVGVNSTAMIEAAIVGKSVMTVLNSEFAQMTTLHFHHLLVENGGFLHTASTLEEHAEQLARVLNEDVEGAVRQNRFVESFVRPHGLDRPATPILAEAIEQLVRVPVDRPPRPSLLRPVLALSAGLNAVYARLRLRQLARSNEEMKKKQDMARPDVAASA